MENEKVFKIYVFQQQQKKVHVGRKIYHEALSKYSCQFFVNILLPFKW